MKPSRPRGRPSAGDASPGVFTKTARFYDAVYAALGKDYRREAREVGALVEGTNPTARTLLDVGCGTGAHLSVFSERFECAGIDKDPQMVGLARARCPELDIEPGDMLDFKRDARYDAITCLFAAVTYARTLARLGEAVANMRRHLAPGGVLIVEPFVSKHDYLPGTLHSVFVDQPDLKLARMNLSKQVGSIAIMDFDYLVGTLTGIERYFERHEVGLFEESDYRLAFTAATLTFASHESETFGRGLYVGNDR
jgi:ubiquinone/menaquinone biosynthesis C-methylase UbiE